MKTAKKIATLEGWHGIAHVFELDPPIEYGWDDDDRATTQYVIVSAADVMFTGPETYIFAAEKQGDIFDVADWGELPGSFRGALDHAKALEGLGYVVEA